MSKQKKFKVEQSDVVFTDYFKTETSELEGVSLEAIVDIVLKFYRERRAAYCKFENQGDMLLYQWGTYDWGEGEYFDFDITRQFIRGADNMFQLDTRLRFKPDDTLRAIEASNQWCKTPDELASFREYILSSEAFKAVSQRQNIEFVIRLDKV